MADDATVVIDTPHEMQAWSLAQLRAGRRVALVPTMGALHDGHLALVNAARSRADVVVVSIFVNPLQFNSRTDFESYPRPIDADVERCAHAGVDVVYAPTAAVMYPPGFQTHVEPGALAAPLEGANRPGHFRGVLTVVAKLFNAVQPDVAVFGEKDYQQLTVIKRMARDLDMRVDVVGLPTVREPDGLAMSSRNRRLEPRQRDAAVVVPRALGAVEHAVRAGERDVVRLVATASAAVAAEPLAKLEHVELVDPGTLEPVSRVDADTLVVIAVWFGDVRLIDNRIVHVQPESGATRRG